jgi:AcrR family transcriptional regulator
MSLATLPAETTKDLLLASGTRLFSTRGFDGTTIEEIARGAGVNKALISYHFGGKAGLYQAILESTFQGIQDGLEQLQRRPCGADEKMRLFLDLFARMNESQPGFSAMILREVLSGGEHLDERVLPGFLSVFSHVNRVITQGVREGAFRPVDPLLTHLSLVGALVFFFATGPLRERLIGERRIPVVAPQASDYLAHLQELFSRGLAAGGSGHGASGHTG